mmetsp:Transcript_12947/g.31177  ORF Transcript_12947/g.31177 Transcript_12947/m.31177 type:complete len:203 (-) Transcript_12947:207-815(-)
MGQAKACCACEDRRDVTEVVDLPVSLEVAEDVCGGPHTPSPLPPAQVVATGGKSLGRSSDCDEGPVTARVNTDKEDPGVGQTNEACVQAVQGLALPAASKSTAEGRFKITVEKGLDDQMGMHLRLRRERGVSELVVLDVGPGLVKNYNVEATDHLRVASGCRVVAVNGSAVVDDPMQVLMSMKQPGRFDIELLRPLSPAPSS